MTNFDTTGFKKVRIISFHGVTFERRRNFALFYNKNEHRLVYEAYNEYENIYVYVELIFESNKMQKKYLGYYEGESIFSLNKKMLN